MTGENIQAIPTVSELVRRNYRAADVLRKWGINYCCSGNVSLAEACALKGIDEAAVQQDLNAAGRQICLPAGLQYQDWPVEFLIDYIVHVHHAYLKQVLPALHQQLNGFVKGHTKKYPYLQEVGDVFNDLKTELEEHNAKEEERIFPYLRQIASTYKRRETYGSLFVRTLGKPLDKMVAIDHNRIAALLDQLRSVTNQYHFAEGACTNHQVLYHKLKELDNDLVQHKHLENNILYPRVLQMEQELLQPVS
ncbi:regulator of cell morphogenesis and NO signaling [Cnuella takakiae]|uniref:Regulator of cell morphogenesis and NO signaling n=1 Tax=Cnuella takakiae TaxID=1302690 RepID=A0A1M4X8K3_9BACT|nr:DUF542 domain-containing protein [Cnuella takakiae]OLY91501.1 hypothetical protein BUE76_05990 [Cnuella takakiae]SHE89763.1 regulator of cell morphogenesis and NO signaling [Cnuella takakiae]